LNLRGQFNRLSIQVGEFDMNIAQCLFKVEILIDFLWRDDNIPTGSKDPLGGVNFGESNDFAEYGKGGKDG
jgi:hypothetical protein